MSNLHHLYYQYVRSQEERGYATLSFEVWRDFIGHNFE